MVTGTVLHVDSPSFNLYTVSPPFRPNPESAQPRAKLSGHQETLATAMSSEIDLACNIIDCACSLTQYKFSLHYVNPPFHPNPESATESKASGHWETLAAAMVTGIVLHVDSPSLNLHPVSPPFVPIQRAHNRKQSYQLIGSHQL